MNRPLILVCLVILGLTNQGCSRSICEENELLFEQAIMSNDNGPDQIGALKKLFKIGKSVEIPKDIWLQGPVAGEAKSATEDLEGMKSPKLVNIDRIHYVFYGWLDGKYHISLLCIRNYPDGKRRFVVLTEAMYVDD